MTPSYTTDEVRRILRLSQQTFRTCLRAASFPAQPNGSQQRFSFQDLLILRTAKGLLEAGVPAGRIRIVLASLKRQLPEGQALSHVKIYADGRRVIVWDATGHWQPDSGQFLLDFEVDEVKRSGKIRTFEPPATPERQITRQQWYDRALELEQDSPEEACHAYQEALRVDPMFTSAHLNLGLLYHLSNDLEGAEACYRRAIECGPDEPLGYFNLAGLLKQKGDRQGALAAYRQAVQRQPDLMEAHEQLALLYDAEGNTTMAFRHGAASYKLKKLQRHGGRRSERPRPR